MLAVLHSFSVVQRQRHLFLFRPFERPTEDPKGWWIYAFKLLTGRDDILHRKVSSYLISSYIILYYLISSYLTLSDLILSYVTLSHNIIDSNSLIDFISLFSLCCLRSKKTDPDKTKQNKSKQKETSQDNSRALQFFSQTFFLIVIG